MRSGKCSQCGAEYKVPSSFTHDVARCKVCQGVVHLSAAKPATPAAAETPKPAPQAEGGLQAVQPRLEKGQGSTLARLRAERQKAAAAATARPAARPTPAKPASARPAGAPQAAAPKATAGSRTAAPRGGARSGSRGKDEYGDSGSSRGAGRRAGGREKRKKSMVPAILALVFIAVLSGGVWMFKDQLFGKGGGSSAEVAAQEPAGNEAAPMATEAPPADEGASMEAGESDAGDAMAADDGEEMEKEPEADPFADKEPAKKEVDVNSVDLSELADFGPVDDTTDEEWQDMNEQAAKWMDYNAGAAGGRAGKKLLEQGRKAIPVVLNHMKKLDFSTPEGQSNGDQCQRALQDLCNGINFDWKYTTEPADVLFNKKVVVAWAKQWERAEKDIEYWIKMAKLEEKDPAEAKRLREAFGDGMAAPATPKPPSGGGDDLDVD